MKKFVALAFALSVAATTAVLAQDEAQPGAAGAQAGGPAAAGRGAGRGGRGGNGRGDPHIVSPSANKDLHAPDAPMLPYHFVEKPVAPNGQKFGNVSGVALTKDDHLLIFDRNPALMMAEFDRSNKFIRTFDPNIAINTHGLRIDSHGNIWALDSYLNVIWKLNAKGEPIMAVGKRGEVAKWDDAKWNGMFNQPLDIAFDKDDNFYVIQGHGGTSAPPACTYCATYSNVTPPVTQGSDPRLFKFDKNGNYVSSISLPHADGTYPTLHSVIVTPKGEVWATDRQLNKIMVFDTNLKPLRDIQEPNLTSGLFVDAKGKIWMSCGMDGMIMSLDADGKVTGWIGKGGRDPDGTSDLIGEAHYLVVTPDEKTIYIADSVNGKVLKLEHN